MLQEEEGVEEWASPKEPRRGGKHPHSVLPQIELGRMGGSSGGSGHFFGDDEDSQHLKYPRYDHSRKRTGLLRRWEDMRGGLALSLGRSTWLTRPYTIPLVVTSLTMRLPEVLGLLLVFAFVFTVGDTAREGGPGLSRLIGFVLLLVSKNNVLTLVSGVSWERLIKYHRLLGVLVLPPMYLHGDRHHLLMRWDDTVHVTGNLAFLAYLTFGLLATSFVRRRFFNVFYASHVCLTYSFVLLILLHDPYVRQAVLWSLLLLAADKLYTSLRARGCLGLGRGGGGKASLVGVSRGQGERLVRIEVEWKTDFRAGQYAFLHFPALSCWEWHPFSISSSPSTPGAVTFHALSGCGEGGDWSRRLVSLCAGASMRVDGPYGVCAVPYECCEHVVLVAGGVGITPMASILGELLNGEEGSGRSRREGGGDDDEHSMGEVGAVRTMHMPQLRTVELHWAVRSSTELHTFRDLLERVQRAKQVPLDEQKEEGDQEWLPRVRFSAQVYVTGAEVGGGGGGGGEGGEGGEGGDGSGGNFGAKQGRPDLRAVLLDLVAREGLRGGTAPGGGRERVAVLACGPRGLLRAAGAACSAAGRGGGMAFHFHEETFQL